MVPPLAPTIVGPECRSLPLRVAGVAAATIPWFWHRTLSFPIGWRLAARMGVNRKMVFGYPLVAVAVAVAVARFRFQVVLVDPLLGVLVQVGLVGLVGLVSLRRRL